MAQSSDHDSRDDECEGPLEIAFVGDLTDQESDMADKILAVPPGGACTIYFDSPGGSPYTALSLMTLISLRRVEAVGVITGECSSAALWPFAVCRHRFVTPFSYSLFHPIKWQSEERVGLAEAAEWARHFGDLEGLMDRILAERFGLTSEQLNAWGQPGRYVSGMEMAEAGIAELISASALADYQAPLDHRLPSPPDDD